MNIIPEPLAHRRAVRSFVRRQGRTTPAQRTAISNYWDQFGLDDASRDWSTVFGRTTFPYMEIGFGMGDVLLSFASRYPERDFLGGEVYEPSIGRVLSALASKGLSNVRIIREDAVEVLARFVADSSLAGVFVFFPDPWPKKRHHKRRLIQPEFVAQVAAKLRPAGVFELATDWEHYAQQMLEGIGANPLFHNTAGPGCFYRGESLRPVTKFERRGIGLGHQDRDLKYARVHNSVHDA